MQSPWPPNVAAMCPEETCSHSMARHSMHTPKQNRITGQRFMNPHPARRICVATCRCVCGCAAERDARVPATRGYTGPGMRPCAHASEVRECVRKTFLAAPAPPWKNATVPLHTARKRESPTSPVHTDRQHWRARARTYTSTHTHSYRNQREIPSTRGATTTRRPTTPILMHDR